MLSPLHQERVTTVFKVTVIFHDIKDMDSLQDFLKEHLLPGLENIPGVVKTHISQLLPSPTVPSDAPQDPILELAFYYPHSEAFEESMKHEATYKLTSTLMQNNFSVGNYQMFVGTEEIYYNK